VTARASGILAVAARAPMLILMAAAAAAGVAAGGLAADHGQASLWTVLMVLAVVLAAANGYGKAYSP
jgi:hypothetical protein